VPKRSSYSYSVVRVVPHVDREEFLNAGVVVFCDALDLLCARIELDETRLLSLAPRADIPFLKRHLEAIPVVSAGGPSAGPIGALPARERWRWLVAPRSTVVQMSAPHGGLCLALEDELERLMDRLVRVSVP
jgi:hypothetical protein